MIQPPIVGPIAGAKVAVIPKSASPIGCFDNGRQRSTIVIAIGMNTPPVKPWPARHTIIIERLVENPHSTEKTRNSTQFAIRNRFVENTSDSQAESGIAMISAIR